VDFTTITVEILKGISNIAGGYGMAIIFLTVLVRLIMWPLSVSQQRSMKKMQELSPKLKEIQNRYKSDPPTMQKKMMEFYKEHNFNPFGGCFPLLLQMPIFIMLYAALISPQFIEVAGNSSFLFINRLDTPIRSHAGVEGDKVFGVAQSDTFSSGKYVTVYTKDGVIKDVKVKDPNKAFYNKDHKLEVTPGKLLSLSFNSDQFDLPADTINKVEKADIPVFNNTTKEIELINFDKKDSSLSAQVKTEGVKTTFNYDVLVLILLFGVTMFFSQKALSSMSTTAAMDPSQKAMQDQMGKIMPIMITATFVFFPIPAGVLLYLVVSNIIQVIQTIVINKQLETEKSKQPKIITDKVPTNVKDITAKEVSKKEEDKSAKEPQQTGLSKKKRRDRRKNK
jgi:YidC/Oxa1 family membrane protein insertase